MQIKMQLICITLEYLFNFFYLGDIKFNKNGFKKGEKLKTY